MDQNNNLPLMIDVALTLLADRELVGDPVVVDAEDIIDYLGWEHTYANYKGVTLSLPLNGFVRVSAGVFTL